MSGVWRMAGRTEGGGVMRNATGYTFWLGIEGEPSDELIVPDELVVDHTTPHDLQEEE